MLYNQRILLLLSLTLFVTTAFLAVPLIRNNGIKIPPSSSLHAFAADKNRNNNNNNNDDYKDDREKVQKKRRLSEFVNLDPLPVSDKTRERIELEEQNKVKFVEYGNDLWKLRSNIDELSHELLEASDKGETDIENGIRETLSKVEQRDPELVYRTELELMKDAVSEERSEDATEHMENALNARSCLPQLNLEGLWVGKYGDHGYEMINVTYAGDILIAYKVTGDNNVPRGEITFQADLNPLNPSRIIDHRVDEYNREPLKPIVLTDKASKKWGTKQLPRSHGLGRVAEDNFENAQWMEGQLIIIGEDYFSFAWVPIEHQIFFGRPSPELTLKMLRDGGVSILKEKTWDEAPTPDDDITVWKDYAAHCFAKTEETIDEDLLGNEFSCIWHGVDTEECYFE